MSSRSGKDGYLYQRHNKTLLYAHIIFVTKYREKLTANGLWDRIKQEVYKSCQKIHVEVVKMESDKDHLHMLIKYPLQLSISDIVHKLKQETTWHLWQSFGGYLKKVYWHERTLWSDGYFASSVGNASKETVEEYIRTQG